jgi:hypothetical protein
MFSRVGRSVKDKHASTIRTIPPKNYFSHDLTQPHEKADCIKNISYEQAKEIYKACGVTIEVINVFYRVDDNNLMCFVDNNRQFCVPGLNFIDALHTTGKVRDYLTCNIEAPELSKNRNLNKPKDAWLGLERAQSFFKFLGVSNLNAENFYTFLCLHTLPINLYAMRNTDSGGFSATYLIPIEPTPESQIMLEVKTLLAKVQKMITRTPTEERTP